MDSSKLQEARHQFMLKQLSPEARAAYVDFDESTMDFVGKCPAFPEEMKLARDIGKNLSDLLCYMIDKDF